jgi:hypothetical protein
MNIENLTNIEIPVYLKFTNIQIPVYLKFTNIQIPEIYKYSNTLSGVYMVYSYMVTSLTWYDIYYHMV